MEETKPKERIGGITTILLLLFIALLYAFYKTFINK